MNMGRGHTPYGYRIENGCAVIHEEEAIQVRMLCEHYLNGLGLDEAARKAGLELPHSSVKRLMLNPHYAGDDFYPPILDAKTQEAIEKERQKRSRALGRDKRPRRHKPAAPVQTKFRMKEAEEHFSDPFEEAAYLYSLIGKET